MHPSIEVFEYLDLNKIQFLIAIKQSEFVKKRGNNAKKKTIKTVKGEIKTILKERNYETKKNFHLAISHNHKFEFNQAMSQIAAIAYNVKNMFVSDKKILQTKNEIIKLSTLQRKLIHIPGIIVNNGGKIRDSRM